MASSSDHFSAGAASYARYRPQYPPALFEWLAAEAPDLARAWDCGTGSGQAAVALARRCGEVIATDASETQLAHAARAHGLHYLVMTAERAGLADRSVGLVTVAQALHWFDRTAFFAEVSRVLRPRGVLCVWSYGLLHVDAQIDPILHDFHAKTVGPFWPAERATVESAYSSIVLPFAPLAPPTLDMDAQWTLRQLAGYLSTWSAVARYRAHRGVDPVPPLLDRLAAAWGADEATHHIRWPLTILAAKRGD